MIVIISLFETVTYIRQFQTLIYFSELGDRIVYRTNPCEVRRFMSMAEIHFACILEKYMS